MDAAHDAYSKAWLEYWDAWTGYERALALFKKKSAVCATAETKFRNAEKDYDKCPQSMRAWYIYDRAWLSRDKAEFQYAEAEQTKWDADAALVRAEIHIKKTAKEIPEYRGLPFCSLPRPVHERGEG